MNAMAKVQEKRETIKCLGSGAWAGVAGAEWRGEEGMRVLDAGEEKSRLRLRTSLQPGSRFGRERWGLKPDRTSSYWLWGWEEGSRGSPASSFRSRVAGAPFT